MTHIEKVLFTGKTLTTASRHAGATRGHEGSLDIRLSAPGHAAHPDHVFESAQPHPTAEQLFAGAWSACLITAIGLAAKEKRVALPADLALEVAIDLGMTGNAYFLGARIDVSMPGVARDVAEAVVHAADDMCPYSKATRGNIDVAINVI
ncbi:Ohr family peroxiredoxin [Paraburkholderia phymatum]|uniref:OsmC family protein n=1 Tax=Paraburkholderia phymatum (strain DSM 17167 / CIP 108236 / LMG 21445 / STM815) TaxID=391038 RepID=B2JSV8_PARP8|nr:Ohr family peroxiredoxin [Paraburkholderia phymatum]ACC75661.1 OsmC family protein [Paraburkholderia phymatum STM815]